MIGKYVLLGLMLSLAWEPDDTHTIRGIIRDKTTNEPIPFAHVSVGDMGNISNIDGEFMLTAKALHEGSVLKVSHMGYEVFKKPIDLTQPYHTIYLEPAVIQLGEVTVINGDSFMDKVFGRFHLNYEMRKQHLLAYYQESMSDSSMMYYLAEGILNIYVPSNVDKYPTPLVKPVKTRKKVHTSFDTKMQLGGHAGDMAQSSIWRSDSFLNSKNRGSFIFNYGGMTRFEGNEVCIIEVEPKKRKGHVEAKLYIDQNSLAIIRIEHYPPIKDSKEWERIEWIEQYEEHKGVFRLSSVSFKGITPQLKYTYNALLVVNKATPLKHIPANLQYLDRDDSFFAQASNNFKDSFWDGYNYLKLDANSTKLTLTN
jgi:hypothetical protein